MNNETCTYRSTFSDSGDRGADMADHRRTAHADHTHVWGDSPYKWERAQRCQECAVAPSDVITCG